MSEPTSDPTCAATVGCRRNPTIGYVCAGHFARLGDTLAALSSEVTNLNAVPSMQAKTGRSGGLASQRAPARLDVLVHTDPRRGVPGLSDKARDDPAAYDDTPSVLDVLHSWARLVREERNYASRGPVTIATEREMLARHLEWMCQQAWIDEAYRDLTRLLATLQAANGQRTEKPMARCVRVVGDRLCGGDIWVQDVVQLATKADGTVMRVTVPDGPAVCDSCGVRWETAADKARLNLMIQQAHDELTRPRTEDGRPMFTAVELVTQGKVSTVSNVRTMAHRAGKVTVDGHYDPQWFERPSKATA